MYKKTYAVYFILASILLSLNMAAPRLVAAQGLLNSSLRSIRESRMVWAHVVPVFPMEINNIYRQIYGALYPLNLGNQASSQSIPKDINTAMSEGIDGFAIDSLPDITPVTYYLKAADHTPHFKIAPCLDFGGTAATTPAGREAWVVSGIKNYCQVAATHPSAARVGGKFVVFQYGPEGLPASNWQDAKRLLSQAGCQIYWVGDTGVNFNNSPPVKAIQQAIELTSSDYDLGYNFINILPTYWNTFLESFREYSVPFAGGMWPGYYRGYDAPLPYGPFGSDAIASSLYRGRWESELVAGLPWIVITTWNDYTEHTDISPDSDFMTLRSDLTTWYTSRYKNGPVPFTQPRLYITTPQNLYIGESGTVEALGINPTENTYVLNLQLMRPDGAVVKSSASTRVAPHGISVATLNFTPDPSQEFYISNATLGIGTLRRSNIMSSVNSAPIVIFPISKPTGDHAPSRYYSIPASQVLPGGVVAKFINSNQVQVTVQVNVHPRFVDLLRDGNLVTTLDLPPVNKGSLVIPLPTKVLVRKTDDNDYFTDYNINYSNYVVRVIDDQNRVGYSKPF